MSILEKIANSAPVRAATLAVGLVVGGDALESAVMPGGHRPAAEAKGGEMNSVSNYGQYQALSNNPEYQWAGSYELETPSGQKYYASCVAIAPTLVWTCAVYSKSYKYGSYQ